MQFIGLDVETKSNVIDHDEYALQPWRATLGFATRQARITAISVVSERGFTQLSKLEPTLGDITKLLMALAKQPDVIIIGWNAPFDIAWLIAYGFENLVRKLTWADGMVYQRCLENHPDKPQKGEYGLKANVAKHFPEHAGYESKVAGDFNKIDGTLLEYNHSDAALTARIGRLFWDRLDERERVLCNVVNAACVPFAATWARGLSIDREHLANWKKTVEGDIARQLDYLRQQGLERSTLTSPKKLASLLEGKGYDVQKENGKSSVDRATLSKLRGDHLIDCVSEFKQSNTALTKFITGTSKSLEYNGGDTVHPSLRIWNTYTGRIGYSSKIRANKREFPAGIPIHQWTRGSISRSCIVARKGFLLAECDFATQESRLLADFSGDPTLLKIFNDGLDFHTYMASRIAGVDYDDLDSGIRGNDKEAKNFRQLAKVVNLGLAYRSSARTLIVVARTQFNVTLTESQAFTYHRLFRDVYEGVPDYWNDAIKIAKQAGHAETRGARKVKIADWGKRKWASESTAINFPIQGTGADMKFLGIGCVDQFLYQNGCYYTLDGHDAMLFEVPDSPEGLNLARRTQSILSNLPYEQVFGWKPKVPMPVGLKVGKSWGSMIEDF